MLVSKSEIQPVFIWELAEWAPILMCDILLCGSNMTNLAFASGFWAAASSCQLCFLEDLIVSKNYQDMALQRLRAWCWWHMCPLTLVWLSTSLALRPIPLRRIIWVLASSGLSKPSSEDVCGVGKANLYPDPHSSLWGLSAKGTQILSGSDILDLFSAANSCKVC